MPPGERQRLRAIEHDLRCRQGLSIRQAGNTDMRGIWRGKRFTHDYVPVPRQPWNEPCYARRTDGGLCRAWSVRGGYVCAVHGGRSPQARAQADFRLWRARLYVRFGMELAASLQALDARRETDPDGYRAEILGWLAGIRERDRQFRRVYGRRPRKGELSLIVDGPLQADATGI
jgi:hypothetical protein